MIIAPQLALFLLMQQPAAPPMPAGAVVLDHVVAVINGSVILQSDVNEEVGYSVLTPFSNRARRTNPQRAFERLLLLKTASSRPAAKPPMQKGHRCATGTETDAKWVR